jgi:CBS domain-containing protein
MHLDHIRVKDAMHHGILTCWTDAPLEQVAGIMSKHRVHAVAVTEGDATEPVGVVSDRDVVAAIARGAQSSAGQAAATEPLAVSADQSLRRAAQMMSDHEVSHLVVRDAASGQPIGVLSTLDLAAVYAREDAES